MRKRLLKKKILLAVCAGGLFAMHPAYAATGLTVPSNNFTDNSNEISQKEVADGYVSVTGVGNAGYSGFTLSNTAISITASAESTDGVAGTTGIFNSGSTNISGDTDITIMAIGGTVTSTSTSADAYAYGGIWNSGSVSISGDANITATAIGGTAMSAFADASGISNFGSVSISGDTDINVTAIGGTASAANGYANANAYGIYNASGTVNLEKNVTITTSAMAKNGVAYAYALHANGGTININQATGHPYTVKLTGDLLANGGIINLNLNNSSSFLRGNVIANGVTINLTLTNNAVWQPVYDNRNGTFNNFSANYSATKNTIRALNLSGGIVDLTWDNNKRTAYRTLNITDLSGTGGKIKINTNLSGNTGDTLAAALSTGANLGVAITYDPIMDTLSGVGYHAINTAGTYSPVTNSGAGSLTLTGVTSESKAYSYVPVFTGTNITGLELGASSNTKVAASAASGQATMMQTSVNHLRKRLGDLRDVADTESGAWARVYNGEITNDKYGTVESDYKGFQVGYDKSKQVKDGRKYFGGALSYTASDNSFASGTGNDEGYDVALYQTWMGDSGHYYDIIAKRGRVNSDYQVTDLSGNHSTADYKTWTTSLSAEYGYKKQLQNGWYLEPQAELTFGHLNSVSYTTSSGMNVQQDGINRLIGRMGIGVGKKLVNGNHLYTSLSALHEFKGMETIKADTLNYSQNMSGTWYEFILGTTAKLSDHSNGYVNVEKLFGNDIHSNWQVNAGCRWSF